MAHEHIPYFQNDSGREIIEIAVKKFMCIGATPPLDHPHIFINMGAADEEICPYCSTKYIYNPNIAEEACLAEHGFLIKDITDI